MPSFLNKLVKKIADKKAVNALIPILAEEDDSARFYAALALGKIGSTEAV